MKIRDIIILIFLFLLFFGIIILFSASSFIAFQNKNFGNDPYYFFKKQLLHLFIGIIALIIAYKFKLEHLHKVGRISMFFSTILLILVLLIGKDINGARRWLHFGLTFQPSDIAEISMIIFLSTFFADIKSKKPQQIILVLIWSFINVSLILIEPNISTAAVFTVYIFVIMIVSDINKKYIYSTMLVFVPVIIIAILKYQHAINRIIGFLNPAHESVQTQSSLLALGNGGFFGAGPGLGKIKLLYLPEAYSDFIFAIIGEEFGLIGSLLIMSLFFILFHQGIKLAMKTVEMRQKLLAFSISFIIFFKAMIHIGISVKLLPTTGIGLPFFSYGGSSLIITLTLIGLLLNISNERDYEN